MPEKKRKAIEKINLLISFLDEENDEILMSIEKELLSLNKQENTILKQLISDIDNPDISRRIKNIVILNNFRFSETELLHWLSINDKSLFDLLTIIAKIEYPDLDCKSLRIHYDKILKEVWTSIPAEFSPLDVAKLLKSAFFNVQKFKMLPSNSIIVRHFMINDVLQTKETNKLFLNILYICIARDLGIPIVPLMIESLLILAFENKEPYNISFIDNKFLFFIDNTTLSPYPDAKLRQKFNIKEDVDLPYERFTDTEIATTLLNWLDNLYLQNKKELLSERIKSLIEKIEEK